MSVNGRAEIWAEISLEVLAVMKVGVGSVSCFRYEGAEGRLPCRKVFIIWVRQWLISSRGTERRRLSFSVEVEMGVCEIAGVDWMYVLEKGLMR